MDWYPGEMIIKKLVLIDLIHCDESLLKHIPSENVARCSK